MRNENPMVQQHFKKLARAMCNEGIETTPDQVEEHLDGIAKKIEEAGADPLECLLWLALNGDRPAKPPYLGYWESQEEALEYAQWAEETHQVKLIVVGKGKKWKILETL